MFCRNCGNQLKESDLFCNQCGMKQEVQSEQSKDVNNVAPSYDDKKSNFWLSNLFVFIMFLINAILTAVNVVVAGIKSLIDANIGNGLLLIVLPVIVVFYIIPHIIGIILSLINIKQKNKLLLIFTFIASLFSVISVIAAYNVGITFVICLISNIALSIITLIKLSSKIYE